MPSMKSILTTLVIALVAVAIAAQVAKKTKIGATIFG